MRANAGALATILGLFKDRIHHPVVLSVLQNCDLRVGDILFSSAEDLSSKPSCVGVPTWDCRGFSCVCLSCRQSSVCVHFFLQLCQDILVLPVFLFFCIYYLSK